MKTDIFTVIDGVDITLTNVNGDKTIDLSKLVLNIEFNESIYEYFLNGKLTIIDTLDLIKNFPIIGNEDITFNIHESGTSSKIYYFKVYKIRKDSSNNKGEVKRKTIEIYFCSKEAIDNSLLSISKKFEDKSENIIQTLLTDYYQSSKELSIDPTIDDVTVYSNFWKPSKLIDFISRISKTSDYSDFIFYETLENGFHFKTLSNLLDQESVQNIVFETRDVFIGSRNIKIHKFDSYFDLMRNLKGGLFGMTYYKPHDTNYSYIKNESTLNENYEEFTTVGLSRMFDDSLSSAANIVDTNFYDPDVSKIRLSAIKILDNYNFVVRMNGDLTRSSGDILNIDFPNLDNETPINDSFNGNWFIVGIKHMISQSNVYVQNIVLCKNAFFNQRSLSEITNLVSI